jgi:uncharacterized metal-binding protein YceD (DUF177 family)
MGNPLQERRAPQDLAASGQIIEITNEISVFERLVEIIATDLAALDPDKIPPDWRDRAVAGQLSFGFIDAQGSVPALTGQVAVTIDVVCQRCLAPFALPINAELRLLFDGDQAISKDGEEYEVWELDEDEVCPADLVEEALIMAIPLVAMHDGDVNCVRAKASQEVVKKMTMPFANLQAQMDKEN